MSMRDFVDALDRLADRTFELLDDTRRRADAGRNDMAAADLERVLLELHHDTDMLRDRAEREAVRIAAYGDEDGASARELLRQARDVLAEAEVERASLSRRTCERVFALRLAIDREVEGLNS